MPMAPMEASSLSHGKDQSQSQALGQEIHLATPLRRRRAASPAPVAGDVPAVVAAKEPPSTRPAPAGAPPGGKKNGACRTAGGVVLMCLGVVFFLLLLPPAPAPEEAMPAASTGPVAKSATLLERVATALACPGPRADIVDILAGAPYEFFRRDIAAGDRLAEQSFHTMFQRLPQLVARVMKEKDVLGVTRPAETELQETVLQLAATGGGWPAALRQRLLAALVGPCKVDCPGSKGADDVALMSSANATALEVDAAFTSHGTVSARIGWLRRAVLNLGAATGIPELRRRAGVYASRPATVMVSTDPITPRECFALRGNATVALRVANNAGSAVIRHIVIEQLPHWVAPELWSLPGRFEVFGEPAGTAGGAADPYTVPLGSFEYVAAAPASQAFELKSPVPVNGLRLSFTAPSSSDPESFFCIYRLRAFDAKPPSCTEATAKTPARLAVAVQG